MTSKEVIQKLGLVALPGEGGFFRRTYESPWKVSAQTLETGRVGERFLTTIIYYLVTPEAFSALHRLFQDEIFHFYLGDPVEMVQIDEASRKIERKILGQQIEKGQELQVIVPGKIWQGTRLVSGGKWALLGTTVTPGYDECDFELADRQELLVKFPEYAEMIRAYTRVQ